MPNPHPAPAPIGNKRGLKLKQEDVRQEAYAQYCAHIARGKSKRSWCFEHPEFTCTWETIEKYMRDEREFDPIHMKIALSKGFAHWETVVEEGAKGVNPDVNPACLQMVMRNKFGWDKEKSSNSEYRGDIGRLADAIRGRCSAESPSDSSDCDSE